jgi:hypothetical protein
MIGQARFLSVLVLSSGVAALLAQTPVVKRPEVIAEIDSPRLALDRSVLTSFPQRDFRRDPPRVHSATAEGLPNGKARVRVTFDEKLPAQIALDLEEGRAVLRDDGVKPDEKAADGIFTADVSLSASILEKQAAATKQRLTAAKADRVTIPTSRRNRVLRRVVLERGALDRKLIPLSPSFGLPGPPPMPPPPIIKDRSLMITAVPVVTDKTRTSNPCQAGTPGGHWSFGFLMTEMANTPLTGISPSDFAMKWLQQWQAAVPINGFNVPARININTDVIAPWQAASGGPVLKMDKAPFRLLAIVNRIDLRDNVGYGQGAGGELRFVYGLVKGPNCTPQQFAVIFEFGVPPKSCSSLKAYANQWASLSGMVPGSPAYNNALQNITDPIVKRNAMPTKPNGSALNQLRTNEIALAVPWELREFRLDATKVLRETTVKQTPHEPLNNTSRFTSFVNANLPAIHAGTYSVPLKFPLLPVPLSFLAANAPAPTAGFFWRGNPQIADNDARQIVSLGTCNGCHAGETRTRFVHINPSTPAGSPAQLSGFLTGIDVADPLLGAPVRHFDDLEERKLDLEGLLGSPCIFHALFFEPLKMTH